MSRRGFVCTDEDMGFVAPKASKRLPYRESVQGWHPPCLLRDTPETEDRLTVLLAQERMHLGTSRDRARSLLSALREDKQTPSDTIRGTRRGQEPSEPNERSTK